jgi:hypothetical protein
MIHDPGKPRSLFKEGLEKLIETKDKHGNPIDLSGLFEAVEGLCEIAYPDLKNKLELIKLINEKYNHPFQGESVFSVVGRE